MKEFIKKLIGRLEEIPVENQCSKCPHKVKCDEVQENINNEYTDLCGATIKVLAIEKVNQLAEEYKPKTNADRIRNMPNEELAEFLSKIVCYCKGRRDGIYCIECPLQSTGACNEEFILNWLKKDANIKN